MGHALGGGHEKSIVGKKLRWQFGNDPNLEITWKLRQFENVVPFQYLFVQALRMLRSKNSSGVCIPPKFKNPAHLFLACRAQRQSAFTSRCETDTAGRAAFEPPPVDGAPTKLFDRELQFRESHTEVEKKNKSWPNPPKKNDRIV